MVEARGGEQSIAVRVVIAACGFLICGAVALPWMEVVVGSHSFTIAGYQLSLFRWVAAALGMSLVIVMVVESIRPPGPRASGAIAPAAIGAVTTGVVIVMAETIAGAVPRDLLPSTLRRATFQVSAGAGLWVAFVASVIAAAAASGLARPGEWIAGDDRPVARLVAVAAVVVGAVLIGVGRYQPTAHGEIAGESLELAGWATPYYGPGTMLALWVVVVTTAVVLFRPSVVAALVLAAVAWAVSLFAGIAIVTSGALARVRLADRLPDRVPAAVRANTVEASVGGGAWLVYCGAAVLLVGAALLFRADPARAGREDV